MSAETRALTIWQPWASLIIQGIKPIEYRTWDFRSKPALRALIGQRIVIHAGAHPLDPYWPLRLRGDVAGPELRQGCFPGNWGAAHAWLKDNIDKLPMSAGLGTVVLGDPVPPPTEEHNWGWPVSDPQPFAVPIPCRGYQGFWRWQPLGDDPDGGSHG